MKPARAPGGRRARKEPALPGRVLAVAIAVALLLLLAPPDSPRFWAVNGFRSLAPAAAFGVLLAALATGAFFAFKPRGPLFWWGVASGIALLVAFPLREQAHLLGDTLLRLKHQRAVVLEMLPVVSASWERLHAQPLDAVVAIALPIALQRLGLTLRDSVSVVSALLALAFFTAGWRLAGRLNAPPGIRAALALSLTLGGALEGFAGYAEVAGLVAVAALWWWAEMLAPLASASQAWRTALVFLALVLSHRLGAAMLLPQLWRALGPAAPGDRPAARAMLAALTLAGVALTAGAAVPTGAARQVALDVREILRSLTPGPGHLVDVANTLLLLAPLLPLALAAATREGRAWMREPSFAWIAAAALPLLAAQVWVFPAGESGLGAMRDWDSGILLGAALTTASGLLLARLPPARLRAALAVAVPLWPWPCRS